MLRAIQFERFVDDVARPWLRAFAPLRETFFRALIAIAALLQSQARAGEGNVSEDDRQMQARLQAIADGVDGTFGLVVADLAGQHRFEVNADRQFTQASCIKTPILLEVLKQAHEGKLQLADRRWVEKQDKTGGSGILAELGDRTVELSIEDLCVLMIVMSDNTATNMLIDQIGMENVTATMALLGCEQTVLRRRMMDAAAAARGEENLSTPADAARILRLLHEGTFVNREVSNHALSILRKLKSGAIRSTVPQSVSVAFKPGELPGLLTEWALVELPERPYIVVVMGTYNPRSSTDDDLDAAMKQVGKEAYKFFKGRK
ncbi:Imipenem-hydrolyzing beta-lactamase precursor [Lacipirellula limnantheis]|uniref:beta-lactamase n=1 Tax=Lacipirellula limnantheis TaxID=2528024 RepID=A0A517U393_9BACT|nr:Imipenem-hydrolyzing beta-lactamase precursor [Lacipirellula limnantheis]